MMTSDGINAPGGGHGRNAALPLLEKGARGVGPAYGRRMVSSVYHFGSFALVISICLQIVARIDALFPTILAVGASRICLAVWQLARPTCAVTERSVAGLLFSAVVWGSTMILLLWSRS